MLYNFTTATFTPGGATGRGGPTLTQARTGLTGPETDAWKNNTEFFNTTNGIQLWNVPVDETYIIECWGAQGGNVFQCGGGLGGFGGEAVGRSSGLAFANTGGGGSGYISGVGGGSSDC